MLLLDHVVAGLEKATGQRVVHLQQVKFLAVLRPDEHALTLCEVVGNTSVTFHVVAQRGEIAVTLASGKLSLQASHDHPAA